MRAVPPRAAAPDPAPYAAAEAAFAEAKSDLDVYLDASMRPRVFPAEDFVEPRHEVLGALASMRPRVFPAEDEQVEVARDTMSAASMRPRVFPAEDLPDRREQALPLFASMRPRVVPAED